LTTSSSGATEGGFDENDRVSMRGTNPSLTQTLIDGHNVAAGDWFVLDQTGTVGRSVSYTLLPSELVSEVVVHKSSGGGPGGRRRRGFSRYHHAQAAGLSQALHA
jgi:iron complex outermembrane recepter protein